jgi:hypothetical protein
LATHSNPRILSGLFLGAAAFWLSGCTAAFGPGYTIEKQEIRVHFLLGPEPHLVLDGDYTLRNTGNQPLSELEVRLPGRRRFHFSNAQALWDNTNVSLGVSPANDRNELLTLPAPWLVSGIHTLHLSIELQSRQGDEKTLGLTSDAFFLPAQGWSPELLPARGAFATGGVPPKKWNLSVSVPGEFLVHTSGESQKRSRRGGEVTVRAEQTIHDYYPFVIAGKYQSAQIGEGDQKVYLWTRTAQPSGSLQQASDALHRTMQAYDDVFGKRIKEERSLWIVECPVAAGCFSPPSAAASQSADNSEQTPAGAELASLDTLMVDTSLGAQKLATIAGPSLAASWLGYGKNPGFYEQDPPLFALPDFAAAIGRDANAGPQARAETIRTALRAIPRNPEKNTKESRAVLRAKSFLFFYALQDRYGMEVFRNATSHMLYARQGGGFDLDDLIAAFDQESRQNLAEFVRLWMKHPGVPQEFRDRYEGSSAATKQTSKEATP